MRQTATLQLLPDGAAGTRATLQFMAGIVREFRKKLPIRNLALTIVRSVEGHKNFFGMAAAVARWVRGNIQYVRDIRDVETVQTPFVTLDLHQGDCDDQATLVASLLESIGFETRFRAVKTDPNGEFVHVVTEAFIAGQWLPFETTEDWEPGTFPVSVAGDMIQGV